MNPALPTGDAPVTSPGEQPLAGHRAARTGQSLVADPFADALSAAAESQATVTTAPSGSGPAQPAPAATRASPRLPTTAAGPGRPGTRVLLGALAAFTEARRSPVAMGLLAGALPVDPVATPSSPAAATPSDPPRPTRTARNAGATAWTTPPRGAPRRGATLEVVLPAPLPPALVPGTFPARPRALLRLEPVPSSDLATGGTSGSDEPAAGPASASPTLASHRASAPAAAAMASVLPHPALVPAPPSHDTHAAGAGATSGSVGADASRPIAPPPAAPSTSGSAPALPPSSGRFAAPGLLASMVAGAVPGRAQPLADASGSPEPIPARASHPAPLASPASPASPNAAAVRRAGGRAEPSSATPATTPTASPPLARPPGAPAPRPAPAGESSAPAGDRAAPAPRARLEAALPFALAPAARLGRELASAVRLAGPDHAAQPGHDHRAQRPAQAEEPRREPTATPNAAAAGAPAPQPARNEAASPTAPAAPARPAAPLHLEEWPSGGAALASGTAHVRLTSDTLGDVALHLRLRDGAATVRLEADAPSALEGRAPELARALAAEGISLTRLDVERREAVPAPARETGSAQSGQPGSGQAGGANAGDGGQARHDPQGGDDAPPPAAPNAQPSTPTLRRPRRGAHDVTA